MEKFYITNTNYRGLPSGLLVLQINEYSSRYIIMDTGVKAGYEQICREIENSVDPIILDAISLWGRVYYRVSIPSTCLTKIESDQYTGRLFNQHGEIHMVVRKKPNSPWWRVISHSYGCESTHTKIQGTQDWSGGNYYFAGHDEKLISKLNFIQEIKKPNLEPGHYMINKVYDFLPAGVVVYVDGEKTDDKRYKCKVLFSTYIQKIGSFALHTCTRKFDSDCGYNIPDIHLTKIPEHSSIGEKLTIGGESYGIVYYDSVDTAFNSPFGLYLLNSNIDDNGESATIRVRLKITTNLINRWVGEEYTETKSVEKAPLNENASKVPPTMIKTGEVEIVIRRVKIDLF